MKIERRVDNESTGSLYCVLSTVTKSGRIFAQSCLWTLDHILPDLFRDSNEGSSALFVSVNSVSAIFDNGLLFR